MFELIVLVVVFCIGYQIGMSVFAYRIRHLLYKEAKIRGIEVSAKSLDLEDSKPTVAKLFIEKSNNVMYLYEYDANTFVCQANTIDDLAALAMKYNNIKYAVVANGDDMLMFVDGEVKLK